MSFFILKPDVTARRLVGQVLAMIEGAGFRVLSLRMMVADECRVRCHYREHEGRDYYEPLVRSLAGKVVVAGTVCAGGETVARLRELAGPYANPGKDTIRGRFAVSRMENSIHTSADAASVLREAALWLD